MIPEDYLMPEIGRIKFDFLERYFGFGDLYI
jgi:hypothetical protein